MINLTKKKQKPPASSFEKYFLKLAIDLGWQEHLRMFTSNHIYSQGIKLHLDIIEVNKKAPTLVFIPGTSVYGLCFAELLALIAQQGYNIVSFDPRGHGLSEGLRGDYTINELVIDAKSTITYALENFNENVALMGCSQGGIAAFYTAADDDRLKTVICQNIADLGSSDTHQLSRKPELLKKIKPIFMQLANIFPKMQIPISAYLDLQNRPIKHFGTVGNFIQSDPITLKTIRLRALQSLANTQLAKPIEQIKTPMLVMQPGDDHIFPLSYTQNLFDKLNCKKQLEIFPNLQHVMMFENSQTVAPVIIKWLNNIFYDQ